MYKLCDYILIKSLCLYKYQSILSSQQKGWETAKGKYQQHHKRRNMQWAMTAVEATKFVSCTHIVCLVVINAGHGLLRKGIMFVLYHEHFFWGHDQHLDKNTAYTFTPGSGC